MNHVSDQDLLLLQHQSLGLFKSVMATIHLRGCKSCRKRATEIGSFTFGVAAAVRGGLPAWKPLGMALRMKLMLVVLAVGASYLAVQGAIAWHEQATMPPSSCQTLPPIQPQAVPKPLQRGILRFSKGVTPSAARPDQSQGR